jgi:hypothetical protein
VHNIASPPALTEPVPSRQVGEKETGLPRTLAIHTPNGTIEYWFTDRVFVVGDTFEHAGEMWVVTSISEKRGATDKHVSVTVRRADMLPS